MRASPRRDAKRRLPDSFDDVVRDGSWFAERPLAAGRVCDIKQPSAQYQGLYPSCIFRLGKSR
jgi:hypothetical protein